MNKIPYDATRKSLYSPGDAVDFFQLTAVPTQSDSTLCAEMARLAYVKEVDRLEAYLSRAGYERHWHIGYGHRGTQLFIAKIRLESGEYQVVVSFRGTEPDDPSDLVADAVLLKTPWQDITGNNRGLVHKGFADALLNDALNGHVLAQIQQQLDELLDQTASIFLTGHSLGAALAILLTSYFKDSIFLEKMHTYTFGAPRVGDADFASSVADDKHSRYVNCCDLVTRIPTESLGFLHNGTLHYLDRHGLSQTYSEAAIAEDRSLAAMAYLQDFSCLGGTVWVRELADHSPVNYVSAVAGLRA